LAGTVLGLTSEERERIRVGLDHFVSDLDGSGELEKLEDTLGEFNLFEALGTINAEIRHSNFLAWLLDPNGSHGLGDIIVKRFLQRALIHLGDERPLTPVDLDLMDLSDLEVRREWSDIDVLLLSPRNALVIVIENKIGAAESKGQLEKYKARIRKEFPSDGMILWRHLFLFLTIEGGAPSDDAFIPISYMQIVELLDATVRNRDAMLSSDVKMTMRHYVQMLRRQHMEDSELIRLARTVYTKHKAALDFIFENRPDHWSDAREFIASQLNELPVKLEFSTPTFLRFYANSWKPWTEVLSQGTGWKSGGSNQLMLCEIRPDTEKKRARLQLVLGPGPVDARNRLVQALKEAQVFTSKAYPFWTTLVVKPWRELGDEGDSDPRKSADRLIADTKAFLADEAGKVVMALKLAFGEGRSEPSSDPSTG
jgi:hypothetical protein